MCDAAFKSQPALYAILMSKHRRQGVQVVAVLLLEEEEEEEGGGRLQ
jgi:hypothetical protein